MLLVLIVLLDYLNQQIETKCYPWQIVKQIVALEELLVVRLSLRLLLDRFQWFSHFLLLLLRVHPLTHFGWRANLLKQLVDGSVLHCHLRVVLSRPQTSPFVLGLDGSFDQPYGLDVLNQYRNYHQIRIQPSNWYEDLLVERLIVF